MEKEYLKEYLYILDFGDCTINCLYIHNADKKPDEFENTEELLEYWGFNPDTCMYMYSSDELEINNIVVPLKIKIMLEQKIEISDELITREVIAFAEVAAECIGLYAKKNHDYGNSFDKEMSTMGLSYGVGRLFDKMNRLISLTNGKSQQVKDESIDDTLRDLACYSIMMLAYRKKEIENKQKQINFE